MKTDHDYRYCIRPIPMATNGEYPSCHTGSVISRRWHMKYHCEYSAEFMRCNRVRRQKVILSTPRTEEKSKVVGTLPILP